MAVESVSALIPAWPHGAEPKWLAGPLVGAGIVLRLVQDLAASSIPFTLEAADSGGVWRFGAGQAPDPLSPWGEGRGCLGPFYLDAFGKTPGASASYPQALCLALSPTALTALGIGCATAAAEKQEPAEYRIIQPDGSLRWIWDRAFPVRDETGRIYRFVGIAEDITERKRAEEALRRSEARLSEAQRVGRLGSWEWDIVKNEIALSDEMCNILGVPQQSASWNFETALGFVHPDDRESVNKSMREALHEERRRIARELHDGVGQSLTALSMNLAAIVRETIKLQPRGRKAISESEVLAEDCLRKIRTLSHLLHMKTTR